MLRIRTYNNWIRNTARGCNPMHDFRDFIMLILWFILHRKEA